MIDKTLVKGSPVYANARERLPLQTVRNSQASFIWITKRTKEIRTTIDIGEIQFPNVAR